MKKTLLILFSALLFNVTIRAQVANYSFTQTSGTYTPITGGIVRAYGTADDSAYAGLNIGFTFKFNGVNYTTFGLNTNGWIRMGSSAPVNTYLPVSASNSNTNVISAMGKDLQMGYTSTGNYTAGSKTISAVSSTVGFSVGDVFATATGFPAGTKVTAVGSTTLTVNNAATSSGSAGTYTVKGTIRYGVLGTAPNRVCVIQWTKARRFGVTATTGRNDFFNFQIRLHETSNVVKVVYGTYQTNSTSSNYEIGLRGNSNTDFNNRKTTTNWSGTTAGTTSTSVCSLYSTVKPTSGLNYTWTPSASSCNGTPTAGTVSGSSAVCASQIFVLTLTGYTSNVSGIALQWQKASSLTGTYTNISGATAATFSTSQTVNTYYRCNVKCLNTGASANSNVLSVTMNAPSACYCTPPASDCSNGGIYGLTFGGINSGSQCSQGGYTYYPTPNPTFNRGVNYPLRVRSLMSDNGNAAAWIDYNRNGSFESSEYIGLLTNPIDDETFDYFANVLIPSTASLGETRIRIRTCDPDYFFAQDGACGYFASGETEDYKITIGSASSCSGAPTSGYVVTSLVGLTGAGYVGWGLNLTLVNYSTTLGITFQWQKSTSLNGAYTNIAGAITPSYNTTIVNGTTYYRCKVTCTSSGQSVYSVGKKVTGTPLLLREGEVSIVNVSTPSVVDEFADLSIYPNPSVDGLVNIAIEDATFTELTIEIMDMQGKQVYTATDNFNASTYSKQINVSELAKGIYYLRLSTTATIKTEKLIVQ